MLKMETYAYKYIPITLKDGQENRLILVDEKNNIFMFDYVLRHKYSYDVLTDEPNTLDNKVLPFVPDEIRQIMLPFQNGSYIRLQTKEEVLSFEYYKDIRNRIGIDTKEGVVRYLLADKDSEESTNNMYNIIMDNDGYLSLENRYNICSIRPLIKIKK